MSACLQQLAASSVTLCMAEQPISSYAGQVTAAVTRAGVQMQTAQLCWLHYLVFFCELPVQPQQCNPAVLDLKTANKAHHHVMTCICIWQQPQSERCA